MMDVLFILLAAGFFLLSAGLVTLSGALMES
jgi:hypothetical protein